MITPEMKEIKTYIDNAFRYAFDAGLLWSGGIYNRRYIAGTKTWSQHAYGNAYDIMVKNKEIGDKVFDYLMKMKTNGVKIGTVLWQVPAHYDHLHIEPARKRRGTPPRTSGKPAFSENDREAVREIQRVLNEAGFGPLVQDGLPGTKTRQAFDMLADRWKTN